MDINRNNCESFFLLYLDKELNAAEQAEVEIFLKEHTDLQKEFSLLQLTKQWPAEIVFDQKELLYRNEEKRRAIPIYWTRIAAAFVLILAGTFFMRSMLRNNRSDISGRKQSTTEKLYQSDLKPGADKIPVQEQKNQTHTRETADHGSQGSQPVVINSVKSSAPGSKKGQVAGNITQTIQDAPDDLATLTPKFNAGVELQTSVARNAVVVPGQFLNATKTPALTIAVASKNPGSGIVNEDLADIQTDNSISVIALNDRNKGITSFFKKLTQRTSGNETAENTKKLRVGVFQISY